MTAPTKIPEVFSISHAQILDGATSFIETAFADYDEDLDIFGVADGSLEADTDSYDNEGDDKVMSTWEWMTKATVTCQAGYISMPVYSSITGRPVVTTGTGATTVHEMDLWHEDDFAQSARPMILKCPSRDSRKQARDFVFGLYAVSFGPIVPEGPSYKEGTKWNYGGTANFSLYDEAGVAFPDGKARVGRLLSIGKVAPTP